MRNLKPALALVVCAAACVAACGSGSGSGSAVAPSAAPAPAPLLTIAEMTAGIFTAWAPGLAPYLMGHSVTVLPPYSYTGPHFSWLDDKKNPSLAVGTMVIFTREYLGPAQGIGPSTPGFLARSVRIEGSDFVFDDSVVLNPGATYWFLEETAGAFSRYFTTGNVDVYPGGDFYNASVDGTWVRREVRPGSKEDASFRLSGRPR